MKIDSTSHDCKVQMYISQEALIRVAFGHDATRDQLAQTFFNRGLNQWLLDTMLPALRKGELCPREENALLIKTGGEGGAETQGNSATPK